MGAGVKIKSRDFIDTASVGWIGNNCMPNYEPMPSMMSTSRRSPVVSRQRNFFCPQLPAASCVVLFAFVSLCFSSPAKITLLRVPDGGIQPQVAVDGRGIAHMIYFRGDPAAGDVFYVRSTDGMSFSRPLQVNSRPGSAIATGNVRGAHVAVGKKGRVHVAWMGSRAASAGGPVPMLYSRLNDARDRFEPERNVVQFAYGLDGGGSVAADRFGNVYVAWHAPEPGAKGEENRRVWLARSVDEGKTFSREQVAWDERTGACGCCGMRVLADSRGRLYLLYRSARQTVHRDMHLLVSNDQGTSFAGKKIDDWKVSHCVMSTAALSESPSGVRAAWETEEQVHYAPVEPRAAGTFVPSVAPGPAGRRKHPVMAANRFGETLLVWTEGMGWNKGGSLAWQLFDRQGAPTTEHGQADGVPVWSLVAAFARPAGGFTIVY